MKNSIWSISLICLVFLLILPPSCKKDETAAKKNPTITWSNPADITYGTLLSATQLNATADVAGTFVYTPAIGTKLEVGTAQNLKVDFTPTEATNYNSISKSVKINVTAIVTATDIDGNVYHVVTIGTQVWMVENLNVTKYNDGTALPKVTDGTAWAALTTGAYCNYGNTDSYATTYGRIYNWYAIETRKLAPIGWHVPSMDEWNTLIAFLGGPAIAGGKLKAIGSSWASPNAGATNETGFTGLPGGDRSGNGGYASDGGHYRVGEFGVWWSCSLGYDGAWNYILSYDESSIDGSTEEYGNYYNNFNYGKSVRLIKGDEIATKKNPVITWSNPADIYYGTLLSETQLNASADVGGTFVYTPALNYKLNAGATQNLRVDFSPLDAYNYNTVTKTVTINVTKANPIITWLNPMNIVNGTPLSTTQLNATANVAGTFVYTPSSGTILNVGVDQNLKVDFTPVDAINYNIATKTVTINVTKIDPIITWQSPMDIVTGTPLSATQLNATANVAGTFVYTPSSGTILSVGVDQDLKVDFTPVDAINYNIATKTVLITVTPDPPSTINDIDGNIYNTVKIGNQLWMKENLKTTKYNDGTFIPNITDNTAWAALSTGAYSDYDNNPNNSTTYGRQYNWYAIDNNMATKVASNGGKNVCPTGWHVFTEDEWTTLTNYLGGEVVAGGKLKEAGTTHWITPNTGATNETGFTALPGGTRDENGPYLNIGSLGYWWSSTTENIDSYPWFSSTYYNSSNVYNSYIGKNWGSSVRCVWDF